MGFLPYIKKILFTLIILIFIWISLFAESSYMSKILIFFNKSNLIQCYRSGGETLPEISSVEVKKGKSIFFHETSCKSYDNGKIVISSREACAVESAALLNPDLDVYLLFTSPGLIRFEDTESDRFLRALLSYDNIYILHLNYANYVNGTPLEELYSKGILENSLYPMSHASDILRYLTLWKYGGIYLDLDIIVTKDLSSLPPNFAGCESDQNVAAGIMAFEPKGVGNGNNLVEECVMDLKAHFSGSKWGNNGPGVVTRLMKKHCNVNKCKDAINKDCGGFKILPQKNFYPIPWQSWKQYFDEKTSNHVVNITRKDSYIVHVWNKHSASTKLAIDSRSAYVTLAKKFCPGVFQECDKYF